MKPAAFLVLLTILIATAAVARAEDAGVTNPECPVMEGTPVDETLFVDYRGVRVYFSCESCDHRFEELVLGSETVTCPSCGSQRLTKLPTTFGVGAATGAAPEAVGPPPGCPSFGDPGVPGACSLN